MRDALSFPLSRFADDSPTYWTHWALETYETPQRALQLSNCRETLQQHLELVVAVVKPFPHHQLADDVRRSIVEEDPWVKGCTWTKGAHCWDPFWGADGADAALFATHLSPSLSPPACVGPPHRCFAPWWFCPHQSYSESPKQSAAASSILGHCYKIDLLDTIIQSKLG